MDTATYIQIILFLLSLVTVFHLCIVAKLIPYNIAWGGRLKSDSQMYAFEAVSIVVNLFLMLVLLIKGHYIAFEWNENAVNIVLWAFFFLFLLNTVGNILAKTAFEKSFAILTLILATLIWMVL